MGRSLRLPSPCQRPGGRVQAYSSSDLFPQVVLHEAPVKGAGEEAGQVVSLSKDNIAEAAALITEASHSPDILESVTLSGDGSHAWLGVSNGVGSVDLSHASFKSFECASCVPERGRRTAIL